MEEENLLKQKTLTRENKMINNLNVIQFDCDGFQKTVGTCVIDNVRTSFIFAFTSTIDIISINGERHSIHNSLFNEIWAKATY